MDVKEAYLCQPKFRLSVDRLKMATTCSSYAPEAEKWLELELGSFTLSQQQPVELQFRISETKSDNWKSGLFFNGLVIRASSLTNAGGRGKRLVMIDELAALLRTPREECYPDVNATQEKERVLTCHCDQYGKR